ncbi:MAG: OmpA family protein, partial [Cyclobacteriaceae bacterium]|nr:OmpA family protein [Cyclobacteriaceae bacterium]
YDESDESKFEKKVIDGQTILSLPTFYVTEASKEQKQQKVSSSRYDKTLLETVVKIYFNAGASKLEDKYHTDLNEILEILNNNDMLGVIISGYASTEGDEQMNIELSNQRAIGVLEYLNHQGIVRRRIVARGYGETKVEEVSAKESRRVELQIVDLAEYNRL